MNQNLETTTQSIETVTGKKLLTLADSAVYLGTDLDTISELMQTGDIRTVSGKFVRAVDLAKFECGIPSETPHENHTKHLDSNAISALPFASLNFEEFIVSEVEFQMGVVAGGSVFFNTTREVWQFAYYYDDAGVKKRRVETCHNEQDAHNRQQLLNTGSIQNKPVQSMIPSVLITQQAKSKMLVRDYLSDIMEREITRGISHTSKQSYEYDAKYIYRALGDRYIQDLRRSEIQLFLDTLTLKNGKPASDAVKGRVYSIMSKMMAMADVDEHIRKNPMCVRIKIEKSTKTNDSLDSWFQFDVLKRILEAVEGHKIYYPLIMTLLHTGIRIGELIALTWEKIDFENGVIVINNSLKRFKSAVNESGQTILAEIDPDDEENKKIRGKVIECIDDYKIGSPKNGLARIIPVSISLLNILWTVREKQLDKSVEWVFPNQNGQMRSYDGLRCQMAKHWKKHKLDTEEIRFHRFRHSTATYLRGAEVSEDVISAILGHKREGMTAGIYMDIIGDLKRDAIDAYDKYMRAKLGTW